MRSAVILSLTIIAAAPLPAQRPSCAPAQQPKELPSVSFLIDSGGALMELQAAKVLHDSMQFTLFMLPADSIPVIHAIDSTNALAAAVLARSLWPEKPTELWAVRLHVAGGATPALTITRATYCPPVLSKASGAPVRMRPELREERIVSSSAPGTSPTTTLPRVTGTDAVPAIFELELSERGDISSLTLIRSSGSHVFDSLTAGQLLHQKYEPALLDGIPVPAVIRPGKNGTDQPLPTRP